MNDIRVAAAIFNAPLGDVDGNIRRMSGLCHDAADKGASLICFPEMSITGYSASKDIPPLALSCESPPVETLRRISQERNLTILAGMAETDQAGHVFATQLVFIPGKPLGKYRKIHTSPAEKHVFSQGVDAPVFESGGFRFGVQLCYDAHFPFIASRMAEKGADAIFIAHASPRGTPEEKFQSWMRHIPARSYDNSLYVVAVNQAGDNGAGLTFPGLAFVTDPSGYVIANNVSGQEGLLFADLTQKTLDHVRNHRMRYFLPHARYDVQ